MTSASPLESFVPSAFRNLADPARSLPRLAKDPSAIEQIEAALRGVPTKHEVVLGDARMVDLPKRSIHLLNELDAVWRMCHSALVPGGRLVCVVGDVCLSRRKNGGRHTVVPLHASVQERCRAIGFDNLAPIIWAKIANAAHEVNRGTGGFLGKPYEPNAVVKNDIEFILMQRKPGGYRKPTLAARVPSLLSQECFQMSVAEVGSASRSARQRHTA